MTSGKTTTNQDTQEKKKGHTHAQYPGSKLQQVCCCLRGHLFKITDRLKHSGGGSFPQLHYFE